MGGQRLQRAIGTCGVLLFVAVGIPFGGRSRTDLTPAAARTLPAVAAHAEGTGDTQLVDPAELVPTYRDPDAGVSMVPPHGWTLAPSTSLDRGGDEQAYEVARFQLHVGDPALYAQPLPVTGGLLADAQAVVSIGIAREGSDLASVDLSALAPDAVVHLPGATAIDSETSYAGVATITRILIARDTGRTAVVRAYVPVADRDALASRILASISSATVDPEGPSGPAYVAPPPAAAAAIPGAAAAAPAAAQVSAASVTSSDPSAVARTEIVARASLMLGTPYVWGGDAVGIGMDCSAYVSAAWGVGRYTTDSIWDVAVPVAKADLLPGDAMDLETWRDPDGYGHIRLFEAWANAAHSLVWVYEETPSRAIHRVIAYDDAYTPMRLAGLSNDGAAPVVPAPASKPSQLLQHSGSGSKPQHSGTWSKLRGSAPRPPSARHAPAATRRTYTPPATKSPAAAVHPSLTWGQDDDPEDATWTPRAAPTSTPRAARPSTPPARPNPEWTPRAPRPTPQVKRPSRHAERP